MSLAVAIIRSRSKGLEAEPKITHVHKLCSRRQAKEMSSETNSVLDGVDEMYTALQRAQGEFHKAINDLDVSIKGKVDQFAKAFEAYGTGKNNIPNRFQRWFWKLRHEITKEPIVWEKPDGSGAVYINWGSETCPATSSSDFESGLSSTAAVSLLYSGRAAGTLSKSWAGGRNFECMKIKEPKISKAINTQPKPAYLDAVEYRTLIEPEKSRPIPCAACMVPETVAVKTLFAQTSCPKNWRKEYSGITMADSSSNVDGEFICLNKEVFERPAESEAGVNTSKLNPVWMSCEKCDGEKIVPCVVCSYENRSQIE
ncbi:uncharacterized protein TNCV_3495461 [Trichonephila clavipes]|nr:uncharacterized protein TNCV_3495461 [Trichonephila clavipes]